MGAFVSLEQDAVRIRAEQLNRACFSMLSASLGLVFNFTLLPLLDSALVLPAMRLPLMFKDDQGQPRNIPDVLPHLVRLAMYSPSILQNVRSKLDLITHTSAKAVEPKVMTKEPITMGAPFYFRSHLELLLHPPSLERAEAQQECGFLLCSYSFLPPLPAVKIRSRLRKTPMGKLSQLLPCLD